MISGATLWNAADEGPYLPPAGGEKSGGGRELAHARVVIPGPALDEDDRPVRLRVYSRCCGTGLFAGLHDFNGAFWTTRLYESADAQTEDAILTCPGCGSGLFCDDPEHSVRKMAHVFSLAEVDQVLAKERERLCLGEAFDERTLAALNCELGEGLTFEEIAPLYGRTTDELRAELEAWLGGGGTQSEKV